MMEKNRETRASSIILSSSSSTSSSRRRNRATVFRDLSEESHVELQETVRLKERISKRDRDHDRDNDEVEDFSTNQQWKVVPRKARSVSVKRSHDSTVSGEEIRTVTEVVSTKKKKKKMKPMELKTPTVKTTNSSVKEGDIEIEIAEVLYGLMKQTHNGNQEIENGVISDLAGSVSDEKNKVIHESSLHRSAKIEVASDFNMNLVSHEGQTEVIEPEESKPMEDVLTGGDDSIPTTSNPEAETKKEEILKLDLMAPPLSPERSGLDDTVSCARRLNLEVEMEKETSSKVENEEKVIDENEDKVVTSGKKLEFFKLDWEKTHLDGIKKQEESQKQPSIRTAGPIEKNESSSSVHLPISLGSWPPAEYSSNDGRYLPTFQTVVPMDGVDKASTKLQHPKFILSYPRPKRCLTHYDIARNIYLHQQFTKTNYLQPAADASASLTEAKLKNMSSSESMVLGNPLHGNHLDVNIHSIQQREQAAADFSGNAVYDKSPETADFFGMAKSKQHVYQQSQGASLNNSVPGPGFIFPISQHQGPIAATANQCGSTKASNSATLLFNNPNAGTHESFPALPAGSSNMSYSHPNLVSIEAPYLAKLQNNVYPFPFSTPAGTTTTYRANPAQALPLFSGPFFSSQMYHPSHVQPPQTLSQTQSHHAVQSIHQSGGSLSHKHPQTQQQKWSVHVPGNNLLPSNSMQVRPSMEQHLPLSNQSRKYENETSGEDTTSLSDMRTPQVQKTVYGQNFMLPVQALNFTLMPSTTLSNGNVGNQGEKKQSHPQNLKSTVAIVPSQALTMSFASFGGSGTSSNLSFAPMAQNTAVFQSIPDIQRAGFSVAPAPQATKQKNHPISEGRNGGILSNPSDRNTGNSGKTSATSGQTLVFSNSARTLNFTSSPVPGSWPSPSIKSAGITTNRPPAGSPPGSQQQQQLLQLQQQHILQQPPATMTPRMKVLTNNSLPSSSGTTKFPYNSPSFSQSLTQRDNSIQSPLPKNSGRMGASNVPQGQTQITFGGDLKPAFAQMQHSPSSSGKLRNNSTSSKTGSSGATLQSKQDENSSAGPPQKSSPVCGRNLPSILNACPAHLSELKY